MTAGKRFWKLLTRDLWRPFRSRPCDARDLSDILQNANDRLLIELDVFNIINRALNAGNTQVRDIMVPRPRMKTLKADGSLEQWINEIIDGKHSRYPVVDGSLDKVIGLLLPKDLLPFITRQQEQPISDMDLKQLLRTANFVPESQSLSQLLGFLRKRRSHLALVLDEHGGVSGLVTMEDALEEIIGEIEDEHDPLTVENILNTGDSQWEVNALTPIDEINRVIGHKLPSGGVETIGGLVAQKLERVPEHNDEIQIDGLQIKVLSAQRRRAELLEITRISDHSDTTQQ